MQSKVYRQVSKPLCLNIVGLHYIIAVQTHHTYYNRPEKQYTCPTQPSDPHRHVSFYHKGNTFFYVARR